MRTEIRIGVGGFATLFLLVAKLANVANFSWWWVPAPLVASYVLTFISLFCIAFMMDYEK